MLRIWEKNPDNHGVGKEKLPFQKTVSPKNLWIRPYHSLLRSSYMPVWFLSFNMTLHEVTPPPPKKKN